LKRKKLLDQFIICQKASDIKEIEKSNGLYNSAKQIESNISPSIRPFLIKYEPSLKEYARQRQKEFNDRRRKKQRLYRHNGILDYSYRANRHNETSQTLDT
jgi:uncharacterized circularly permuted ATP-grasp superfamily protein